MRRLWLPLAVLLLAFVAWPRAHADEDKAQELTEEGEIALESEEPKAAVVLFRRAIEASDTWLPAYFGLGEALLEVDKTDEAVVAFRKVVRCAAAREDIPSGWERKVRRAKRKLDEHDERGKELEEAVDQTVTELLRLVEKHKTSDPDLADRALAVILALRPDHDRAGEVRDRMANKGARKTAVFDGKQIDDWDGGRSKWWSVAGGAIQAKAKGVATYIRNQETIEGNFDVIMEAQITDASGEVPFIALMGSWKAEYEHSRFGMLDGSIIWYEYQGEDNRERVFKTPASALRKAVKPGDWITYELRFREDKIHALINGREVHALERPKHRAGGYVGILAQDCNASIRRLDVLHR